MCASKIVNVKTAATTTVIRVAPKMAALKA